MPTRTFRAFGVLTVVAACGGPSPVVPTRGLAGAWHVEATVSQSLRSPDAIGKAVAGQIRFREWLNGEQGAPVPMGSYIGPFDIDFRPIGDKRTGTKSPDVPSDPCQSGTGAATALGRLATPDSVDITLGPCVGHGEIRLTGRLAADTISGAWWVNLPGGSSGTFTMVRSRLGEARPLGAS